MIGRARAKPPEEVHCRLPRDFHLKRKKSKTEIVPSIVTDFNCYSFKCS